MLKTNSKKVNENIRKYVCDNVNFEDDERFSYIKALEKKENVNIFSVYAHVIYNVFYDEMVKGNRSNHNEFDLFNLWCQGLPSVLDTCYYCNRSAIEDLGTILEQSETERERYTEGKACQKLTWLIYREIRKVLK